MGMAKWLRGDDTRAGMTPEKFHMTTKKMYFLSAALLACYGVLGIPYWLTPYSALSLPDSLYTIGLLFVIVGAMAFCISGLGFLMSAASFACVAPAVVTTRIILDLARDSSTHNLFPFEIAIAVFVGFSAAGFGALTGTLIKNLIHLKTGKPEH